MRFILASASPARLQVLRSAGIEAEVMVSGVDEDAVSGAPEELASTLATLKARAVAASMTDPAIVVGCDTLLELDGQALGKPVSVPDAQARWRAMSGRSATLLTGHCLVRTDTNQHAVGVARTEVTFGEPTEAEIAAYVATGEPLKVAGAFTIDGRGGWFVERLLGDHTNVIGISLPLVRQLLSDLKLSVTDFWGTYGRGESPDP